MNDDLFERDLKAVLREMMPEQVPGSLSLRVAEVPHREVRHMLPNAFLRAKSLAGAAAFALVAGSIVAVLALRSVSVGPTPGGPLAPPSTMAPGSSPTASPTDTPTSTMTDSPTAAPFAVGTPEPGDAATATSLGNRYETALVDGQWQLAWSLLAPEQQTHWRSYAAFVGDRSAFFQSVQGRFVAKPPTHDAASLGQWVTPNFPTTANLDRAFLIEVDFPALSGNNAGFEILLVAPDASGRWRIWQVR